MFENIIGYEQHKQQWNTLYKRGSLPSAVCFAGRPQTGRASFALELSRGILCAHGGGRGCSCTSCIYVRLLEHEHILMLGSRDFLPEIYCTREAVFSHRGSHQARMLFYRAVLKLLRRADELLWDGSSSWTRSIKPAAENLQRALSGLREQCAEYERDAGVQPRADKSSPEKIKNDSGDRIIDDIVKQSEKLYSALPAYLYPVHMLRSALAWSQARGRAKAKILLLESTETLHEASSNALLKTLEEPPENVFFMLTASSTSALLPTIISRVRMEVLHPRSMDEEQQVIKEIFCSTPAQLYAKTSAEFLSRFRGKNADESMHIVGVAEKYFNACVSGRTFEEQHIELLKDKDAKQKLQLFLEALQNILRSVCTTGSMPPQLVRILADLYCEAEKNICIKNMAAPAVLEALYYAIAQKIHYYDYKEFFVHSAQ